LIHSPVVVPLGADGEVLDLVAVQVAERGDRVAEGVARIEDACSATAGERRTQEPPSGLGGFSRSP
jgi:hypothetical protein